MRANERGVALITVLLVLLVLTVLGITATVMMTQEDRTSSREDMSRSALYVAEFGLRRGEQTLAGFQYSNYNLTTLLDHTATAPQNWSNAPAAAPVEPTPSVITSWDVGHLGTYLTTSVGGTTELANQEITDQMAVTGFRGGQRAFFSLYVRNNPDDPGGPLTNNDSRIRLISVGWISDSAAQPLAVKVLEEEFNFVGTTQSAQSQKLGNPAGTSSGVYASSS